jgi:hypothetical protein
LLQLRNKTVRIVNGPFGVFWKERLWRLTETENCQDIKHCIVRCTTMF